MNIQIDSYHSTHKAYQQDKTQKQQGNRLTEVIIPQGQNSNAIIFPLVASLSQASSTHTERTSTPRSSDVKRENRWVTWITDRKPNIQFIEQLGASDQSLRIVHIPSATDCRWIIWEALSNGKSHTVIADTSRLTESDLNEMEIAASQGLCNGIISRSR